MIRTACLALTLAATVAVGGCGGSSAQPPASGLPSATGPVATTATTKTGAATTTSGSGAAPAPLQAEAVAAAAGDIPDNQVFLVFDNHSAGYSMKYPEGWAQQGSGKQVTFRDKNNIVRVVVTAGGPPTASSVRTDLAGLAGARVQNAPHRMKVAGEPAFKISYSTESVPNQVTGKRVKLVVDRYYLWRGGRRAVVDLGTPVGVDNVDAYRLMIESFRWK